jgi:glucose dehydrogenase
MQTRRGVSLAKGPIALIGLLGIIYGLTALIVRAHGFSLNFPSGHVHGKFWLHLKVNGWTALLFIAAGLALLFSAAAHITAKSMALLVGVVMIVLAIIGFAQKHGVLGIFAANHWTELIWGLAGVVLLVLALLPRVGGGTVQTAPAATTTAAAPRRESRREVADESAASGQGSVSGQEPVADQDEPLVRREQRVPEDSNEDA